MPKAKINIIHDIWIHWDVVGFQPDHALGTICRAKLNVHLTAKILKFPTLQLPTERLTVKELALQRLAREVLCISLWAQGIAAWPAQLRVQHA